MSLFGGIINVATGGAAGLISSVAGGTKSQKKAAKKAAKAGTLPTQTTEEQLANLNNQLAADQTGLAASAQSQQTWQYVAIGSVVLVVIGGVVMFVLKPKKK